MIFSDAYAINGHFCVYADVVVAVVGMNVLTFNEAISSFRVANYNFVFHSHTFPMLLALNLFCVYVLCVLSCFLFFSFLVGSISHQTNRCHLTFICAAVTIPFAIRIN